MTTNAAAWRNLAFATFSMALGFAVWGLISAFAPSFGAELNLSAQSTAFLVAVPVLGNMGHSAAVFLGPVIAARVGRDNVFYIVAALSRRRSSICIRDAYRRP